MDDPTSHVRRGKQQTSAPPANVRRANQGPILDNPSRQFPFLITDDQPYHVPLGDWSSAPRTCENPPTAATSSTRGGGRHPVYRGIRCRSGKWVSEIREPGKSTRIWLGTFKTAEMAATAYDVASLALKGADALLNFPDSVHSNPIPASTSPSDIRAASMAAAAARLPKWGADETLLAERGEGPAGEGEEFVDEEALFAMPKLLASMAEGMLISPPRSNSQGSDDSPDNSDGGSLWSCG